MSDDLRLLRRWALTSAGVTAMAWFVAGFPLGIVAGLGNHTALDLTIVAASIVPAAIGARHGASRAVALLGRGLPAAAVGVAGAAATICLVALISNLGSTRAALLPTIVWPVVGALIGGWLGGVRVGRGSPRRADPTR